jgi:hypothetical protein
MTYGLKYPLRRSRGSWEGLCGSTYGGGRMPRAMAVVTAAVRSVTDSLAKIRVTWLFTVASVMNNSLTMSGLLVGCLPQQSVTWGPRLDLARSVPRAGSLHFPTARSGLGSPSSVLAFWPRLPRSSSGAGGGLSPDPEKPALTTRRAEWVPGTCCAWQARHLQLLLLALLEGSRGAEAGSSRPTKDVQYPLEHETRALYDRT